MNIQKKVSKNVKVIELIERVAELYFCDEPTDEDIFKITAAFGNYDYQTELTKSERRRYRYRPYHTYVDDQKSNEEEIETIYILNIFKKITKEVED